MAWVIFTDTGTNFAATLATNAVANGWTRCEAGYNWISPASSLNVCQGAMTYLGAVRIYTEISATGFQYTIFEPSVRQSYDQPTHVGIGNGWIGWGCPVYSIGVTANRLANNFTFKGWMDSNCIFGNVVPDSAIPGASTFPIFFCVLTGIDGVNRLVGLDMMPNGAAYRCNARLIYATDALAYFKGLQAGGFGVWPFDNKARLSKLYAIRGGTLVADNVNPAAIEGVFQDPVTSVPYALVSEAQGVEVLDDLTTLTIGGTDYNYQCLYPTLTPPQYYMLTDKASNFNATVVPSRIGADKIITYWVRAT